LFFRKKSDTPAPIKAILPVGTTFYFDETTKKWVNKNATASAEKEETLAPPPIIPAKATATAPMLVSNPSGMPPAPPTSAGSPMASYNTPIPLGAITGSSDLTRAPSKKKRSARSKYVDIINPNATATAYVQPMMVPVWNPNQEIQHIQPVANGSGRGLSVTSTGSSGKKNNIPLDD
jgi:hypothetical protein